MYDRHYVHLENILLQELAEDASRAIEWVKELEKIRYWTTEVATSRKTSFRVFIPDECQKITQEAQDFLLSLEHSGVIDSSTRELAIDSAMIYDESTVDLATMKATVFMVLVSNLLEQEEINKLHAIIFGQSDSQH